MTVHEIAKNIFSVGVKDWTLSEFHGYLTQKGSTYNSYLIKGEKTVLIDGVKAAFTEEWLRNIESLIPLDQIDYLVCNHVEMDHSGSLPALLQKAPKIQVLTPSVAQKELARHYDIGAWNIKPVTTGDTLLVGARTLRFTMIPMVHWPDSMMTFVLEDGILFPNDAFGQHLACSALFDDETDENIFQEAKKYYANIVLPYGPQVAKALKSIEGDTIKMIAPSHGLIWRRDISKIVSLYRDWSSGKTDKKAVVVYDSMWGSTEKMARRIVEAFELKGIPTTLRCLKEHHISDVVSDVMDATYVAIGSPTLNSGVLPTVGSLLTYIKGLRPVSKKGFAFGSYGWKRGALKDIEDTMKLLSWTMPEESFQVNYRPADADLDTLSAVIQKTI